MAKTQRMENNVGKDVETGGNVKWFGYCGKQFGGSSKS